MPASSLFSRILTTLGALAVAGFSFWFIYTGLAPVAVPPPPPMRSALKFDSRADLSKDQRFMNLRALVNDFSITPGTLGRPDPFVPVPVIQAATTTASSTATSAASTVQTPSSTVNAPTF